LSDRWSLRLPPVQFTRVMVGSLVFAPATHAVPDRESGFAFIATSLSPCYICRRVSLNPRRRDSSVYHFKLCGRRFALVVFRLVLLRIDPFSALSFILFLWFALRVHETCLIVRQIQRCHLMLFADTFCGSVFPAFVLVFLFAHHVVMFQYNASGFCSHVVLSGSHAGLS